MTLEGHFFTLNLLKPAGSQVQDVRRLGGKNKHQTLHVSTQEALILQPHTALLGEDGEGPFRPSEWQQSSLRGQRHAKKKTTGDGPPRVSSGEAPGALSTHAALPTRQPRLAAPLW